MVDAELLAVVAGVLAVVAAGVFLAYFMATAGDRSPPRKGSAMFSAIVSLASVACACGVAVCVLALLQAGAFRDGTVIFILIAGGGACGLAYLLAGNTYSGGSRDKYGRLRPSAGDAIFPVLGLLSISPQWLPDRVPWLHGVPVVVTLAVAWGLALTLLSGSLLIRAMRTASPAATMRTQSR